MSTSRYHRQISNVALVFTVVHPVLLFVADAHKYLPPLRFWNAPWRERFAVASVVFLVVLIALTVWRQRLRLRYEAWHASHGVIAVLIVLFALLHATLVGFYVTGLTIRSRRRFSGPTRTKLVPPGTESGDPSPTFCDRQRSGTLTNAVSPVDVRVLARQAAAGWPGYVPGASPGG